MAEELKNAVDAYAAATEAGDLANGDVVDNPGYLNNKFLLRLAQRIGKDYRQLGIFLEFEPHTLEAIRSDNISVVDCAFDVLKTWKYACKKPDSVTAYEALCDALSELRRNDLVEYVTLEAWKKTVQQAPVQATDAEVIERLNTKIDDLQKHLQSLELKINEQVHHVNDQPQTQGRQVQDKVDSMPDVVSSSQQASKQETPSQQKEDTDDAELIAARIKILKAAGQPEKGGDDLRRWALNVMHLLRKHNQPDMWTHVAGLIVKNGTLDVSEVITIANIPDLAFLLASGVACDVTRLDVGGGRRSPSDMWGDMADVTRLCSGVATMTRLRELILFNCQLADDGFSVVSDTIRIHCPELTWLNCGRNKGLTSACKNDVRTTLTQLRGLKIGLSFCSLSPDVSDDLKWEFGDRIYVISQRH